MRYSLSLVISALGLWLPTVLASPHIPIAVGEQSHQSLSQSLEARPHDQQVSVSQSVNEIVRTPDPSQAPRALYTAENGITVWGNVVYSRAWEEAGEIPGFNAYTYSAETGLSVSQIAQDKWMFANGSGAFYDGKFHFISKGTTTYLYGLYDVDSWTQLFQDQSTTRFHKLVATDCDYDPVTGLTYGCFWNPDTQEYEFASVDYESYTHTTIAPMEIFSAIAINSKGVVYGIKESDGGLYTIDKATGQQTFIGNTGVKPYLIQSAAFDRTNDVLYWAVRSVGSVAYLATVNTDNASVKRLAYFPDSEQITCLYVPFKASPDAPGEVSDVSVFPTSEPNEFTVSFTLPSKSSAGDALSASALGYSVTLAGDVKISGSAQPGTKVNEKITLSQGYNALTFTTSSESGKSVPVDRRVWNGKDIPVAVRDLTIDVDNDNDNKVTITWNAPEYGIHNGYIGASALSFDVVRMPENKLVASHIDSMSFTETLGKENAGIYYYIVTPYADDLAGESVETAKISALGVYAVPFSETFDTQASFNSFITIDANSDSKTWFWNDKMQLAEYYANWNADADDWMLSPEISLRAGRLYVVSFDYRGWDPSAPENLRVAIGTGTDVTTYTDIMPTTEVKSYDMEKCQLIFSVPADGAYRVGFQCTSPRTSMYLLVDNFSVDEGPDANAPAAPDQLEVIPDSEGHLTATIKLQTPVSKADGSPLTDNIDILVYRNEDSIPAVTLENVSPGETLQFTDQTTVTGINHYSVVAVNADGRSLASTGSAYIGQDRPQGPSSVTLIDCNDHYALSWEAPSTVGISWPAGPVIPDELTYNIYAPDRSLLCEGVKGCSYDIPDSFAESDPNLVCFHVSAVSPAGEGAVTSSNYILAGRAYDLPFRESFSNGNTPSTYWWVGGNNVFQPTSETSYDGDGGCIRWKNTYWDKYSWFNSAKINIGPAELPVYSFAYYMVPGKKFVIRSYISPEGKDDILLGEIDFASASDEEGWQTATYDLSDYKGYDYVVVKLYVECAEDYDYYTPLYFYVDRIEIIDTKGANLSAASLTVPADLYINQTGEINVIIGNSAAKTSPYTVNLYIDGELTDSYRGEAIAPQALEKISFEYTPDATTGDSVMIQAEVVCDDDLYPADNMTDLMTIKVLRPDYPVVTDLKADGKPEAISLEWSQPVQYDDYVLEDFEDYIHKDSSFGGWSTVDADKGKCYTNQLVDVGFMNIPVSWVIFNTIAAGVPEEDTEYYAPHSGTTATIALLSQPETIDAGSFTDDWLISPELSNSEQHSISFWAKSVKGDKYGDIPFEVLYTEGYPNALDSFQTLASTYAGNEWKQYSMTLPEGARFFAIRFLSESGLYLMVDDIEFNTGVMEITGYSIYRDGVKIADIEAFQTTYVDYNADQNVDHMYQVTTHYSNGESALSEGAKYNKGSGINGVDAAAGPFDVFSVDGVIVRRNATSLDGLPKGVYIVNNVKIIL